MKTIRFSQSLPSRISAILITALLFNPSYVMAAECTGVLVCDPNKGYDNYIKDLLSNMMPVVFTLALALVVYSGIQYMMGGLSPDNSKKAKQRIIGSLIGIIFYLLIRFFANLISPDISIT